MLTGGKLCAGEGSVKGVLARAIDPEMGHLITAHSALLNLETLLVHARADLTRVGTDVRRNVDGLIAARASEAVAQTEIATIATAASAASLDALAPHECREGDGHGEGPRGASHAHRPIVRRKVNRPSPTPSSTPSSRRTGGRWISWEPS